MLLKIELVDVYLKKFKIIQTEYILTSLREFEINWKKLTKFNDTSCFQCTYNLMELTKQLQNLNKPLINIHQASKKADMMSFIQMYTHTYLWRNLLQKIS